MCSLLHWHLSFKLKTLTLLFCQIHYLSQLQVLINQENNVFYISKLIIHMRKEMLFPFLILNPNPKTQNSLWNLLRLNQMLYALCLSYHCNIEVVLFASFSSGCATITGRFAWAQDGIALSVFPIDTAMPYHSGI